MVRFIGRRLGIGVLVLVGALFATYLLVALTANPLRDLATSSDPNKAHLIAERTARLRLDESVLVRFGAWFRGVIGYLWGDGSLGTTVRGDAQVANLMTGYIPVSVRLVATSVILGIVLGVGMGVVTALRQYSSLDYLASFVAFLFYAMPTFWVAVLFKQYAGIRLNDFLQE
ncbi:MAG: ABC transporter permease, partial [Bifidobacteriaceae bacterium]|nr:ABC transporter permease [Bifidobacteriaceae bacterium]